MPPSDGETLAHVVEFLTLADRLEMPVSERQSILGIAGGDWDAIAAVRADAAGLRSEEFRRRLGYILPLMRRAVANNQGPRSDH